MTIPTNSRAVAFDQILRWLSQERTYQDAKWGYGDEPPERIGSELDEDGWFWVSGMLNYTGRIRLFRLTSYQGRQALMKLIATLVHLAELAIIHHGDLPAPGHTSGEIRAWPGGE